MTVNVETSRRGKPEQEMSKPVLSGDLLRLVYQLQRRGHMIAEVVLQVCLLVAIDWRY